MDLLWLVIPAAIAVFVLRTIVIARSLKAAAANPTLADARAFRAAKRSLTAHRDHLTEAVAQPKGHLDAAKRLATLPTSRHSPTTRTPIPDESAVEPSA
ncbi:MAG TPA: hypothetical protein VF992_01600 [Thermoplasmata archaeon]